MNVPEMVAAVITFPVRRAINISTCGRQGKFQLNAVWAAEGWGESITSGVSSDSF